MIEVSSIRARLLGLALVAIIPLVGLFAWNAWQVHTLATDSAKDELSRVARMLAADIEAEAMSGMRLLVALGSQPDVRAGNEPACSAVLGQQLLRTPIIADIYVASPAGDSLCRAYQPEQVTNYADREYFARALQSREAVIGKPVIARPLGRPVLPIALPLLSTSGAVERVLVLGIDLARLGEAYGASRATAGATFTIWDAEGTVLFRYPDNAKWTGTRLSRADLVQLVTAAYGARTVEAVGLDGISRVYAFDTPSQLKGSGITISLGIDHGVLTAPADELLWRSLLGLATVVALVLALGWVFAERTLRTPLGALGEAHRRLASGELNARVKAEGIRGELGRLLRGFNSTAAALETMQAELRNLNAGLEQRVVERTEALESARRETEDLYDNAPCGYHSLDAQGVFLRINATELDWLGYTRDELLGTKRFVELLTPASVEEFHHRFPIFMRTGQISDVEFDLVRKDGSILPVALSATAVKDAQGNFLRSRSTLFDITERRRITHELERQSAELRRANEMKSQFLATMSHELRTPLNAIIGFAEVLKDGLAGPLTDDQIAFASDIHAGGRHLLSLINDILDLSKVEAGMMTLELEAQDLPALLQASLTMVKEKASKQRLRLETDIESGLPSCAADTRKLKQIVFNLLSNAVKFTPKHGWVRLSAQRVLRDQIALPTGIPSRMGEPPSSEALEFVEIAVADNGIGIAADDLPRLFDSFVQIDSSLGRKQQGTGLGLALIKRLTELHGGSVGVSSQPGWGSSFHVWLPLAEAPAKPAAPGKATPPRPLTRQQPLALVVEDDDAAAHLIEQELISEGFTARRAATAEEALVLVTRDVPDLITLDVFLPHMDGWDFLARVKSDASLSGIPIVIISVAGELEHGLALGATRVLHKPFSRQELQTTLAGIVPLNGSGDPCTILVVDDNPSAVELLATQLSSQQCRVLRAYGGREALAAAKRERPDLILLDLMMPDLSGFEVVAHLKADPATAEIGIVVVTAKTLSVDERTALNGSVRGIIAKGGLDASDFVAEVRRAMHSPLSTNA